MVEIVNLRAARKRRARDAAQKTAAENRALHGRTKADKLRDRLAAEKAAAHVEAHRRERAEDGEA
jgi:hypothetical protein